MAQPQSPEPRRPTVAFEQVTIEPNYEPTTTMELKLEIMKLKAENEMTRAVVWDIGACVENHADIIKLNRAKFKEAAVELDRRTLILDQTDNNIKQDMMIICSKIDASTKENDSLLEMARKIEKEFQVQMVSIQVELAAYKTGFDEIQTMQQQIFELAAKKLEQDGVQKMLTSEIQKVVQDIVQTTSTNLEEVRGGMENIFASTAAGLEEVRTGMQQMKHEHDLLQKKVNAAHQKDPLQKNDAWQQALDGSGKSQPEPARFTIHSPEKNVHGTQEPNYSRLFDDKVALSPEYRYDGGDGGERWRRKVRSYWISKCPGLQPILDWAEGMDEEEITRELVDKKVRSQCWMTEVDGTRLGEIVWGFLGICTTGEAQACHEGAGELNGLESWRRIVKHIYRGKEMRIATLRKLVRNPPSIGKLEEVEAGITRYENIIREYQEAGGAAANDQELKSDLLEALPQELRENLLWKSTEPGSFTAFKNHVRNAANHVLYHRGKITSPLNNLEKEQQLQKAHEDNSHGDMEGMICAILRKFGKGGGKGGKGGGRGGQTGTYSPKCVNCGGDHRVSDCQKPTVPVNQRPCFKCGKSGHASKQCPQRTSTGRGLKNMDDISPEEDSPTAFFGCLSREGEHIEKKGKHDKPRGATLADFLPIKLSNRFLSLGEDSAAGDAHDRKSCPRGDKCCGRAGAQSLSGIPLEYVPPVLNDDKLLTPFLDEEEETEEGIFAATEVLETIVIMDSGAVDHAAGPKDIPESVEIIKSDKTRNFVGAKGDPIEHYGSAGVRLEQESGQRVDNTFQVADVVRPLHSVSRTTDNGHDVLFNKGTCYVVPEGVVERIMATVKPEAVYPRRGGLYGAKMKVTDPSCHTTGNRKSSFGRQGQGK